MKIEGNLIKLTKPFAGGQNKRGALIIQTIEQGIKTQNWANITRNNTFSKANVEKERKKKDYHEVLDICLSNLKEKESP